MHGTVEKPHAHQEHWPVGKLFIPKVGTLTFRDTTASPQTPAKPIAIARDVAGHFCASFVCASAEGKNARQHLLSLPMQDGGPPAVACLDLWITSTTTDDEGKKSGPVLYTDRYKKNVSFHNKNLARKKRGSNRWLKERTNHAYTIR